MSFSPRKRVYDMITFRDPEGMDVICSKGGERVTLINGNVTKESREGKEKEHISVENLDDLLLIFQDPLIFFRIDIRGENNEKICEKFEMRAPLIYIDNNPCPYSLKNNGFSGFLNAGIQLLLLSPNFKKYFLTKLVRGSSEDSINDWLEKFQIQNNEYSDEPIMTFSGTPVSKDTTNNFGITPISSMEKIIELLSRNMEGSIILYEEFGIKEVHEYYICNGENGPQFKYKDYKLNYIMKPQYKGKIIPEIFYNNEQISYINNNAAMDLVREGNMKSLPSMDIDPFIDEIEYESRFLNDSVADNVETRYTEDHIQIDRRRIVRTPPFLFISQGFQALISDFLELTTSDGETVEYSLIGKIQKISPRNHVAYVKIEQPYSQKWYSCQDENIRRSRIPSDDHFSEICMFRKVNLSG